MKTDSERVRRYYAQVPEWERLESPSGQLEFGRACSLLSEYLPHRSRVLDLGGGPGRYAMELANFGHRIVLADLSKRLLTNARSTFAEAGIEGQIDGIDEVDACDLGRYEDQEFDAVVAFGPFYHLLDAEERNAAATEMHREHARGGAGDDLGTAACRSRAGPRGAVEQSGGDSNG